MPDYQNLQEDHGQSTEHLSGSKVDVLNDNEALKKKESHASGTLLIQDDVLPGETSKTRFAVTPESKDTKPKKVEKPTPVKGNMVLSRVQLLDGSDFEVQISKVALGGDLVDKICEHLNLLERDYFSLTFRDRNDAKYWLNSAKKIANQLKNGAWVFAFEVKFYPPDPTCLREELTRYMMFLQVRVDILSGRLPCSFVTQALLCSYAAQSQLGDHDYEQYGGGIDYLKTIRFITGQNEELLEKIGELHKTHRGQIPAEAELNYLGNAKNLALYGVHLHAALDFERKPVTVGVCAAGLLIYEDRIRVYRFIWAKIIKISYKRNIFAIQIRTVPSEGVTVTVSLVQYRLPNRKMAKLLWKLAVEHHAFFRLKESDSATMARGMFSRMNPKYRYSGRTQYQTQLAAENVPERASMGIDRGHGNRFTGTLKSLSDMPTYSTDRSEETIERNYSTHTLDLKKKPKGSVPYADTDDDQMGPPRYDDDVDGSRARMYGDGTGMMYSKARLQSSGSTNDVFYTLPGQRNPSQSGNLGYDDRPDCRTPLMGTVNAGRTPYPTGPGYITPGGGPGLATPGAIPGYMTPGGVGYGTLGSLGYNTMGGPAGYGPQYGADDMHRQYGGEQVDQMYANNMTPGYGTQGRFGTQRAGTPGADGLMTPGGGRYMGDGLDDHLKQQGGYGYANGGEAGGWTGQFGTMSNTKTTTRTYTAPDGTVVTEHKTEKDGVIETHIEKRTRISMDFDSAGMADGDVDYDKALAEAIFAVTDMNPDLCVEKIEITKNE